MKIKKILAIAWLVAASEGVMILGAIAAQGHELGVWVGTHIFVAFMAMTYAAINYLSEL